MNAAQTLQSNDCRMASFTWNLAPSTLVDVPEAVFLKQAASAPLARPKHAMVAAKTAALDNLVMCKLPTSPRYGCREIAARAHGCPPRRRRGRILIVDRCRPVTPREAVA